MAKKLITFADVKKALAVDMAKVHKKDLDNLVKAKNLNHIFNAALDTFASAKTNKMMDKLDAQENN